MVRKKQPNFERFAGSIATLVGAGKPHKNQAGKVIKKAKFQLDRKKTRKLKKEAKKERKIRHTLHQSGAALAAPESVKPSTKHQPKKLKKKHVDEEKEVFQSLQEEEMSIFDGKEDNKLTKEEADIANNKEDKIINDMEKRLGFKKKNKGLTPKSLDIDGLGYVLHFKEEQEKASAIEDFSESKADEMFADLDESGDDFSDSGCAVEKLDKDNMEGDTDSSDDPEGEIEMSNDESSDEACPSEGEISNYPAKSNKSDPPPASYVPPHLRNLSQNELLKRKVKGFVNRVSTSNLKKILSDVELLYQNHPRGEVNSAIIGCVKEACLISTIMPARLCAEHMLLIASLAANIGPEFVSPLLEDLAEMFLGETRDRHGKLMNNIASMYCFLYALKVTSCGIIFDIIRTLLKSFTEPDLEVLLYIFKSVGIDIRKDDPQALKDIVQIVNESSAKVVDKSSRFTWFIQTLTAVKNNNVNKIPNYDKSDIIDIQKTFKAVVKTSPNNLQLTLQDLYDVKTKGRWWLVGAAWVGNEQNTKETHQFDSALIALAKKNHMNTEIRRNIFCILMSSQDYLHCFERVLKLGLKSKQEREVIHVTMVCALKCKTYNPFYTNVIKKFCETSKSFQITTQFSVWDRLKDLKSCNERKRLNFILLLTSLICSKNLSLAVLKVVNFAEIDNDDVRFFKDFFVKLLNESEVLITEIFGRLQPLPLDSLKNGIKVFLKHFIKPELSESGKKNMKIALQCF